MTFQIGDVFRAKTGEIVEVLEFTKTLCRFGIRHPETLELTDFEIEGPLENLSGWCEDAGLEKIDLKTYKPTGLSK